MKQYQTIGSGYHAPLNDQTLDDWASKGWRVIAAQFRPGSAEVCSALLERDIPTMPDAPELITMAAHETEQSLPQGQKTTFDFVPGMTPILRTEQSLPQGQKATPPPKRKPRNGGSDA